MAEYYVQVENALAETDQQHQVVDWHQMHGYRWPCIWLPLSPGDGELADTNAGLRVFPAHADQPNAWLWEYRNLTSSAGSGVSGRAHAVAIATSV